MSVEVEYLSNKKIYISIDDRQFDLLYPSIHILKEKTGIYIDRYGDTRVHPAHVSILVRHAVASNTTPALKEVLEFFARAVQQGEVLYFVGD